MEAGATGEQTVGDIAVSSPQMVAKYPSSYGILFSRGGRTRTCDLKFMKLAS